MRFAVMCKAQKREFESPNTVRQINSHSLYMVDATSQAEAEGIGWRYARFYYPESEGYSGHFVASSTIGDESLLNPESQWVRRST